MISMEGSGGAWGRLSALVRSPFLRWHGFQFGSRGSNDVPVRAGSAKGKGTGSLVRVLRLSSCLLLLILFPSRQCLFFLATA